MQARKCRGSCSDSASCLTCTSPPQPLYISLIMCACEDPPSIDADNIFRKVPSVSRDMQLCDSSSFGAFFFFKFSFLSVIMWDINFEPQPTQSPLSGDTLPELRGWSHSECVWFFVPQHWLTDQIYSYICYLREPKIHSVACHSFSFTEKQSWNGINIRCMCCFLWSCR